MENKHRQSGNQEATSYQRWHDGLRANPEYAGLRDEEAARSELWLQLVEARQAAGLTQAEVATRLGVSAARVGRIETRGYDSCTLKTLRRYLQALGSGFELRVTVRQG